MSFGDPRVDLESALIPGQGWASESSRKLSKRRLLHVSELPEWYEPLSIYVRNGYRPAGLSVCSCTATLCQVHNETGNIWTHLLGGVAWVLVSLNSLNSPDLLDRADAFTYKLHAWSYALCFLMPLLSSFAHLYHCLGQRWYVSCWDADHVGILALWLARALCEGYAMMFCHQALWVAWACLCVLVFGACGVFMVVHHSASQVLLPLYAFIHLPLLFCATFEDALWMDTKKQQQEGHGGGHMGSLGSTSVAVFPTASSAQSSSLLMSSSLFDAGGEGAYEVYDDKHQRQHQGGGWQGEEGNEDDLGELLRQGMALTLYGSACGVLGYAVMVGKVPERFFPDGRFDLWLHSHQWWHVLTIVGPVLCLEAGRILLHARLEHACPG